MQSNTSVSLPSELSKIDNKNTVVQRPSSPRQFFERLYGDLETNDSNNKSTCSPVRSELSSSPDYLDER